MPIPGGTSSSLASTREVIAFGVLLALASATQLIRYSFYDNIGAALDGAAWPVRSSTSSALTF
jgi:hypothetical protein